MSLQRLSVGAKLYSLMAVFAACFVGYGVWSHNTLQVAKVHGPYYQQIVQGKDLIADILPPPEYIIESYLTAIELKDLCEEEAGKVEMEKLVAEAAQSTLRGIDETLDSAQGLEQMAAELMALVGEPRAAVSRRADKPAPSSPRRSEPSGGKYRLNAPEDQFAELS